MTMPQADPVYSVVGVENAGYMVPPQLPPDRVTRYHEIQTDHTKVPVGDYEKPVLSNLSMESTEGEWF